MANKTFDVENVARRSIQRAGRSFPPRSKRRVTIAERRERELRAPRSLKVTEVKDAGATTSDVAQDIDEDPAPEEVRGMRKAELLELAERYELGVDNSATRDTIEQAVLAYLEEG